MAKAKAMAHASYPHVHPKDRSAWRAWLAKNHQTASPVWVVLNKKASGKMKMTYADAVEEALCFGWIDALKHPIDEHTYKQSFSPRKATSVWSALNKTRVAALIKSGLMTKAGLVCIEVAKKNGKWTALNDTDAMLMPPDLASALAKNSKAKAFFDALSPSPKKNYLYWINSAKRDETRAVRIKEAVALLAKGIRSRHDVKA